MTIILFITLALICFVSSVHGRGQDSVNNHVMSSFLRFIHPAASKRATGPLVYKGGLVLVHSSSVAIFWKGPTDIAFPTDLVAGVTDYLTYVSGSKGFSVLQQYMNKKGNATHTFSGTYYKTDTNVPTTSNPTSATIGAAACSVLNAQSIKPSNTTIYHVFVPNWPTSYCAFHDSVPCKYTKTGVTTTIAFSYIPTMTVAGSASGGCSAFYSDATTPKVNDLHCNTYSNQTQAIITSLQHELYEAITDRPSTGWLSSGGSEIGDLCQYTAPHQCNVNTNGHKWQLQPMWSNAINGCFQGI